MKSNISQGILDEYLKDLMPIIADLSTVEICINRPGEVWVKNLKDEWRVIKSSDFSEDWAINLSKQVRNSSKQELCEKHPILSYQMSLSEDEPSLRMQIIVPPAASHVSISMRKHSKKEATMEGMLDNDCFSNAFNEQEQGYSKLDLDLFNLFEKKKAYEFLSKAVLNKKTIVVSGETGSGKTFFVGGLINSGVNPHERLISIEDVDELTFHKHPNHVKLFFSSERTGKSEIGMKELFKSVLRMNPCRVFPAELRTGEEAYYFLKNVSSGHPGSITTIHGNNAKTGYEKLVHLIKESKEGQGYSFDELLRSTKMFVDIIIQMKERKVVGINYPAYDKYKQSSYRANT